MFRYGAHNMIWTEHFTRESLPLLEKARRMGFEVFNIRLSNLDTFPAKEVRDQARQLGLELIATTGLDPTHNVASPEPAIRRKGIELLQRMVDVSQETDATILGGCIFAAWGHFTGKERSDEEWRWSVDSVRQVADYAAANTRVTLAVEVFNRFETYFLNLAEDAVRYCRDVGTGNVKVQLDTFHMLHEETSIRRALEVCGKDYLGFVHVSENNRGVPGTGLFDWETLYRSLIELELEVPLVVESFSPDFTDFRRKVAIWRRLADSNDQIAEEGLANLKAIEMRVRASMGA